MVRGVQEITAGDGGDEITGSGGGGATSGCYKWDSNKIINIVI